MHHPAAALKRFSQEREGGNTTSAGHKMIILNRERVDEFIESRPTTTTLTSRLARIAEANVHADQPGEGGHSLSGTYDYDFDSYTEKKTKPGILHLQKSKEFQDTLGCRSRFGEGDGSFFDHWLNSDLLKSKHANDEDGMPLLKYTLEQTRTGFKKHIADARESAAVAESKKNIRAPYMQPYAERRDARIKKEEKEKKLIEDEAKSFKDTAIKSTMIKLFGKTSRPGTSSKILTGSTCPLPVIRPNSSDYIPAEEKLSSISGTAKEQEDIPGLSSAEREVCEKFLKQLLTQVFISGHHLQWLCFKKLP